jgi:hypothetical protein
MTIECFMKTIKAVANIRLSPLGVKTEICAYYDNYDNFGICNVDITYTTNYCPIRKERISLVHDNYCLTAVRFLYYLNRYIDNIAYTRANFLTWLSLSRE